MCTAHRFNCNRPFLSKQRTCERLVHALDAARRRHVFDLWAYVFMPDHVHLVIYRRCDDYSISRILLSIRQPVARKAIAYLKVHHPEGLRAMATGQRARPYHFWQKGGGYDRNIAQVDTLISTVRYIHNNPVRRGLVPRPDGWRYSRAADWEGTGSGPLTIDWDRLP